MFDHDALLKEFDEAAYRAGIEGWPYRLEVERLLAPHRQPHLPAQRSAVYVFSLSESYGVRAPAGASCVLKVGKAGARSDPRFYSHHYNVSAPSTLARSLLKHRVLWPWLGVEDLDEATVKQWMLAHLDRTHFFVPEGCGVLLSNLEVFVRARVGSVFEGS